MANEATKAGPAWVAGLTGARAAGVPLVALSTSDQWAAMRLAARELVDVAVVCSDVVSGLRGVTPAGREWLEAIQGERQAAAGAFGAAAAPGPLGVSIVEAAELALKLPARAVWFCFDADVLLTADEKAVAAVRAVLNLRDPYEADGRTVVLLGAVGVAGYSPRLAGDLYYLADPLPDVEEIRAIVTETGASAEGAGLLGDGWRSEVPAAADALRGLNRFAVRQAAAVVVSERRGLEARPLFDQKNAIVRASKGLIPEWGTETLTDLGGQDRIAWWAEIIMRRKRPAIVVRIEELEKVMGLNDSNNLGNDALSVLLQSFEDRGWSGLVALGPGGSGKSGFSKALAATYALPCYRLDLGAMRGRYVGDSEGAIRGAIETIAAMGDRDVFVVASCNALINIPGPLLRRFRAGIWFFDLPSPAARRVIVEKQCRAHGLDPATWPAALSSHPYSGAEIRNLCALVRDYGVSWDDAATLITPLYVSDAATIKGLRAEARGRYLDAAATGYYPGPVDGPGSEVTSKSPDVMAGGGRAFGAAGGN